MSQDYVNFSRRCILHLHSAFASCIILNIIALSAAISELALIANCINHWFEEESLAAGADSSLGTKV